MEDRRRQSEVLRNLDDPLKVMGIITIKSLGVVFGVYLGFFVVGIFFDPWKLLFGPLGVLAELGTYVGLVVGLAYAEKQDDEHLVPAMIRFYRRRDGRFLYAGAAAAASSNTSWAWVRAWRRKWAPVFGVSKALEPLHELEWLLAQRARAGERQRS